MNKEDFPFFKRRINNREIIYLNSASTSQKPFHVIDAINDLKYSSRKNLPGIILAILKMKTMKSMKFMKLTEEK